MAKTLTRKSKVACDWCGKPKDPYTVIMEGSVVAMSTYITEHVELNKCEACHKAGKTIMDLQDTWVERKAKELYEKRPHKYSWKNARSSKRGQYRRMAHEEWEALGFPK